MLDFVDVFNRQVFVIVAHVLQLANGSVRIVGRRSAGAVFGPPR